MSERRTLEEPAAAATLLAEEIRRLRRQIGLSQQQLAAEIGYTRQYVSLAEQVGRNLPSHDLVRALDARLAAEGKLVHLREQAKAEQRDRRRTVVDQAPPDNGPTESQSAWRAVRTHLIQHRAQLADDAAALYETSWRLPRAPMLTTAGWMPPALVALEDVKLEWDPAPAAPLLTGQEPEVRRLLAQRTPGRGFPSYSSAIRYLSPPHLFENRPCYRLLDVRFTTDGDRPSAVLRFGQSTYFDKVDVAEALGHEIAMAAMHGSCTWRDLPYRSLISDPFDLALRAANTSISMLTLRHDVQRDEATFFLLRRDPAKVLTGGGQYGLVPAGEFQPASISPHSVRTDLDLWRTIVREYSEELLGQPVDYERWPFFRAMQQARERRECRVYVFGIALNALSLSATILAVAVIDATAFDRLFHDLAPVNAEGTLATAGTGGHHGLPFDEETVNRFLNDEPAVSPQVAAILELAWQHRHALLPQS